MLVRSTELAVGTASLTAMTFSSRRRRLARPCAVLGLAVAAVAMCLPAYAAAGTPAGTPVGGEQLGSTGTVVDAPGADPLPTLNAPAWLLADLETGQVLAAQDPHGRHRPASTLKILTALTVLPRLDPNAVYTARWEDANAEGSRAGIVPDATYTVHQLMQALMLVSGNDAANALANAAGGVPQTVAAMNATAQSLGAYDTRAANPSGLDAPGQFTSAYDLAVLARAAMAREDFRGYAATVKAQFPGKMPKGSKPRTTFEIYTQDRLLLNYPGAIGIKTGWTTKARGTFVGAATRNGRTLVATVLGAEQNDAWRQSAKLLTWGFRNYAAAKPVGTLEAVAAPKAETKPGGVTAGKASTAGVTGDGGGLPWWVQLPIVLLSVVMLLRARVLLKRRIRTVRRRQAQLYERRRAARALAATRAPGPRSTPRHLPRPSRPFDDESASTGTGS